MLGIGFWDWLALGVYLVGITALGVTMMLRVKDTADFFMAGRSFNRWFMMFFAFGAGTSGNDAVGVSSKTYTSGMSGIWYQWLWLFATPFYWIIAPIFRRSRCLTTGDFFEQRYDGSVAALYSVVGVTQLTFNIGVLLLGGSKMIQAVSNDAIDYRVAIAAMTVLFVVYGIAGGLAAAIFTDFIQGILTIVLSFMLLPVALTAVGGMGGLREKIADPTVFTIVSPGEINLFHIVMAGLIALIGIVTQPHIMGVCAAGRSEMDGRFGFAVGNLIKRFCTIPWMLVGLCGIALYPGLTGDSAATSPDLVYGLVARDLLPTIMPGLIGIFLAALLASIMSSCDAFMVSSAGLFTQNFYRRHLVKDHDEKHYVLVGRVASLFIVAGGLTFAFLVPDVPTGLEWFFKIQAMMGAAFWLGLFWRRMTVAGAWVGTMAGLAVMFYGTTGMTQTSRADLTGDGRSNHFQLDHASGALTWWEERPEEWPAFARHSVAPGDEGPVRVVDRDGDGDWDIVIGDGARWIENVRGQSAQGAVAASVRRILRTPTTEWILQTAEGEAAVGRGRIQPRFAERAPANMLWEGQLRFSWSTFFYLGAGFLAAILASLVSPRVPAHKLDKFHAALRTPVTGEEPHLGPFDLPEGVTPPAPRKLINHPDLEIPMPTREGMLGFGILWLWVGGLIAFVYWIAGIGA